uniref:Killer cell lectin-like receptor, subfamily A, member 1 n=1 Tax=Mus musculus TaxID=10090 RepID=Q925C6_MOUSE|nr:Killer cell lectin-like receptor, subfamily A, member 1 [Mus musculus]AAK55400.1 natural killer cell receptor Ly49A [Mus musculus]
MSEQEVTYSMVRFHKSAGLQKQVRPEETKGPREAGYRRCSFHWKFIVIALGIFCFLLLVTVSVLAIKIFQYDQQKKLQEFLNHHNNCSNMQGDINLKDEMLKNKSIECDLLESLNRDQNRLYNKTKTVLDSLQHTGRGDKVYWFCYGMKCYYFVMDRKTWSGCKQTCQSSSLSLLKIDDEDELKFLQLVVPSDSCWVGLSYDNKKKDWAWIDNRPSKLALNTRKYNIRDGGCMLLSKTRLDNGNCDQVFICICGKRLDKFPH